MHIHRRTRVPGARVLCTIVRKVVHTGVCMCGAARSNCHTLTLSHLAAGRGKASSMGARSILRASSIRKKQRFFSYPKRYEIDPQRYEKSLFFKENPISYLKTHFSYLSTHFITFWVRFIPWASFSYLGYFVHTLSFYFIHWVSFSYLWYFFIPSTSF